MCMSFGCGEPNERHKPGDIVRDDLEKAAQNHNLDFQQVVRNIQESAQQGQSGNRSQEVDAIVAHHPAALQRPHSPRIVAGRRTG